MYGDNYYGGHTQGFGGWENNYESAYPPPPPFGQDPYGAPAGYPPYGPYGQPPPQQKKKFSLFSKKNKAPKQPQPPPPGPAGPDFNAYYGAGPPQAHFQDQPYPPFNQGPPPPPPQFSGPPPQQAPRFAGPPQPLATIPWTRGVENGIFRAGVLPSEDNISSQANPKDEDHFSQPWVLNTNAPLAWESLKIALLNRGSLIQEESHPTYIFASHGKKVMLEFFIDDFKREIHHRAIGADEDTLRKRIEIIRREYWPLAHGTLSNQEFWRPPTSLPRHRPIIEPMAQKEQDAFAPLVGEELPPVWSPEKAITYPSYHGHESPVRGGFGSPLHGHGSPTFGAGYHPEAQFSSVPFY